MNNHRKAFKSDQNLYWLLILLSLILSVNVQAQPRSVDSYPKPPFSKKTQFYLQRTTDANTIVYDLNFENGRLNDKDPIKPYWIRYTENGVKKSLSGIQNKYAFGVKSTKVHAKHYKLEFAGYSKVPLHLKQSSDGNFQTSVTVDGSELVLQRLYIHIEPGGSYWSPNIGYIEFTGKEMVSGRTVQKRIKP